MTDMTTFHGGMAAVRQGRTGERFRCRLTSFDDVKRLKGACRSQNRQLMRGGRA